ncbi:sodium:alanine symporter family protein [Anaplasma centrale str. Israel]|uniref:Sodium:alanine symporter family protein n=1 Tax=Anaplasma centrale (strain Israel) TaxID=574556 RepID=D1AU56_ANACI|nr:alanine:cation symporter family protein [Anaplasma centrale]ACZ49084.1 sodium:alanine symporter family protein [Anaplasma centrale str. Israel]
MSLLNSLLCIPAVGLLLFAGVRLSIASSWLQIRGLPLAISSLFAGRGRKFSSVAALCTIVGGNLGVGNISGTAVALSSGGPGFIVWMVLIIIVTSIIKYANCYISISTRVPANGKTFGGPVVYIERALGARWAPSVVAFVTAVCAVTVGNLVQVNSLAIPMNLMDLPPLAAGVLMAFALFFVSALGMGFIAKTVSGIVPAMVILYVALCFIVLGKCYDNILPSLTLILTSFLNLDSLKNGATLAFVAEILAVVQVGALRGIFATDIGLGLEGTVHSLVTNEGDDRRFVAQQSLVSLISPFIVAIVAFVTTMVLLTTGVWPDTELESTNMCFAAFTSVLGAGYVEYALLALMFCFSFTTILTWLMCSKEALLYVLRRDFYGKAWTTLFIAIAPIGSVCAVRLVWDIADLSISLAIMVNTIGMLVLASQYRDMFKIAHLK